MQSFAEILTKSLGISEFNQNGKSIICTLGVTSLATVIDDLSSILIEYFCQGMPGMIFAKCVYFED